MAGGRLGPLNFQRNDGNGKAPPDPHPPPPCEIAAPRSQPSLVRARTQARARHGRGSFSALSCAHTAPSGPSSGPAANSWVARAGRGAPAQRARHGPTRLNREKSAQPREETTYLSGVGDLGKEDVEEAFNNDAREFDQGPSRSRQNGKHLGQLSATTVVSGLGV